MRAFYEDVAQLERRKITCQPIPARWPAFARHAMRWQKFPFSQTEAGRVPREPGFFCFFVGQPPASLPPVGYPLYFGRTESTLRRRFAEYIQEQQGVVSRPQVRDFLEIFEGELFFMCTTFNGSADEAAEAAREIREALQPAFGDSEYEASVELGQGAWG
jgi:hypothetical protein